MSKSVDKSGTSPKISVQTIVGFEVLWAFLALMFFLLFGASGVEAGRETGMFWFYNLGTSTFEVGGFLIAGLLCLRNAFSPSIASGRKVWLGIGLGMLSYGIGSILFTYWETFLDRNVAISAGDIFYFLTYLFLGYGMLQAAIDRRLNLEFWQWLIVIAVGAIGVVLGVWIYLISDSKAADQKSFQWLETPPAIAVPAPPPESAAPLPGQAPWQLAQAAPAVKPSPGATAKPATPTKAAPAKAPAKPSPAPASTTPAASPTPAGTEIEKAKPATPEKAAEKAAVPAPAWVEAIDKFLEPFERPVQLFYIIADVFLLLIATILLMAFWGGRYANSWRMLAFATFWLYLADMLFKYVSNQADYRSGSWWEVFWIFSAVFFGIGAALEYDLSKSRKSGRRRA
ncbi:MAG: hypothetical protein VKJ24_04510 [Synechococcales bacterium]|nr:hypothetical protein [Synechococcales bacterium]